MFNIINENDLRELRRNFKDNNILQQMLLVRSTVSLLYTELINITQV